MGFSPLDYALVVLYLIGVTVAGSLISRRQKTSRDYFLGGKEMSWWSVGFSIVASETSTLTFISIPGLAYSGNMHFLQVAIGYFIGRLLVSMICSCGSPSTRTITVTFSPFTTSLLPGRTMSRNGDGAAKACP